MIAVIGGGIVGYCTAYYLAEQGNQVTIIEKSPTRQSPSYWNAGMVVPSHFIPLAAPGVIAKGLKWMFSRSSPFYIAPRFDFDLARWLWLFYRHSNPDHVRTSGPLLRDLNQRSRELFDELITRTGNSQAVNPGLLMLFNSTRGKKEEQSIAQEAADLGIEARMLSEDELRSMDSQVDYTCLGAVHYPGDASLSPSMVMHDLENALIARGVTILNGTEVTRFEVDGSRIKKIVTSKETIIPDQVVLAAGIVSTQLADKLGLRIPMQGGKGYSVTLDQPEKVPSICSILTEAKVAVTPMNGAVRFAGTMEIAGTSMKIRSSRVRGFLQSVQSYLPDYPYDQLAPLQVWTGLRPCSPDGLPYLGRSSKYDNLVINTGHAMMGFSLGPISGKLTAQLCNHEKPEIPIERLKPDRFS